MGRRLNISTPTVINTELVPLDDSFYIEANGQTEQWYYDNTNQFAPNRITTPLTLTPKISAFDQDTQTSYVPSFQSIGWYEQAWDETQQDYVETLITNHVDSSSAEYVISNNNLIVKKNVPYTHAITIRCAAVYTDPRDAGVSCTVETTVVLLTNRDAEVISPTLDILCPPSIAFNPLKDYSSNVATRSKTMKAIASWTGIIPTELLSCKVDPLGTEELIPNNIENLVTCTPYLDIRYGVTEQQDQQFFYRQTSGGLVNPIDGNTSYVSKIKGNTVVWNQLAQENVYVDMGLPSGILWATRNIDVTQKNGFAESPFQYECSFFSWGNVDGHNPTSPTSFSPWDWGSVNAQAPWYEGQVYGDTSGNTLSGDIPVNDKYDAARANNGTPWRMPTTEEFTELVNNVIYIDANGDEIDNTKADKRVTVNGIVGIYLQSKINGARLFFACSGYGTGTILNYIGQSGNYWSSSLYNERYPYFLLFNTAGVFPMYNRYSRYAGFPIRPVLDSGITTGDGNHKFLARNGNLFDLTLIFGAGNEPSTVEEFESWLGTNIGLKDYYPYNEGELIPVRMTGMKTVGFNLFDINKLQDTTYGKATVNGNQVTLTNNTTTAYYVDIDKSLFDKFKTDVDLYFRCTIVSQTGTSLQPRITFFYEDGTYEAINNTNHGVIHLTRKIEHVSLYFSTGGTGVSVVLSDININLSDVSRNGTYEAHWEDTSVFDVTTVKGKLNGQGQDVYIFPNGMKKAGTIQDEIKVENGVVKAIKRVGSVDLGNFDWWFSPARGGVWNATIQGSSIVSSASVIPNAITSVYTTELYGNAVDKSIRQLRTTGEFVIKDSLYTNASQASSFTQSLSGVYLYYELATYEEYTIDPSSLPRGFFEWYGVENGVEVKADTLPWYVSGQNTDTLTIDPMYGEKISVVLRAKKNQSDTSLYPAKAYRNVVWRIPNIDTHVVCANGGAVRSDTQRMDFSSISNANGEVLDDNTKLEQLAFKWVSRRNNESTENNQGWGHEKSITASDLRNTIGAGQSSLASTMVFPYVYLKGAFEKITDNSELVTDGGETVYDRPVE